MKLLSTTLTLILLPLALCVKAGTYEVTCKEHIKEPLPIYETQGKKDFFLESTDIARLTILYGGSKDKLKVIGRENKTDVVGGINIILPDTNGFIWVAFNPGSDSLDLDAKAKFTITPSPSSYRSSC